MRITLRWEKSRDQLVALLGCGGVRAGCVGGVWHHAAQFDDGAGALRSLLLRPVRRWSLCGRMGDGADSAVGKGSCQLSAVSFQSSVFSVQLRPGCEVMWFVSGHPFSNAVIPCRIKCPF